MAKSLPVTGSKGLALGNAGCPCQASKGNGDKNARSMGWDVGGWEGGWTRCVRSRMVDQQSLVLHVSAKACSFHTRQVH